MPSLPGNVQEHPPQDSSGDNGARKKPPKSANPHTRRPPAELTSPAFKEQYEPQLVQQRQREQALTARPKSSAKKELATQVGGGRNSQLHNSSKFLQVVAHEEPRGNAPAKEVTSQDAEEAAVPKRDRISVDLISARKPPRPGVATVGAPVRMACFPTSLPQTRAP